MIEKNHPPSEERSRLKVHVETWGCQMNVADSEQMLSLLANDYRVADDPEDADLIVLNTCNIREKAKQKVLSRLGRLNQLKQKKPSLKIAVAGCVAQAEGKKLIKSAPYIDVVVGPRTFEQLPTLLKSPNLPTGQSVALGFPKALASDTSTHPTLSGKNEVSRYINITQGCDNFCTFCIVPFTRGREVSSPPEEIAAKVRNYVSNGAKEITLLGQNVNSYGNDFNKDSDVPDGSAFVRLLQDIAKIDGLERLRFTTSNPHDFTKPLADLYLDSKNKLGQYLHLPVQSGSDRILQAMKRKVTAEQYHERIGWLRSANPDFAISTDLIVGFPGETEDDFQQTLTLVERVKFSFIYAFMYSPRQGTAASRFKDQIPEEIKSRRLRELNDLQDMITTSWNNKEVGKTRKVMVLYKSKKESNVYYGRTEHFRLTKIRSNHDIVGMTVDTKIVCANKTALEGEIV